MAPADAHILGTLFSEFLTDRHCFLSDPDRSHQSFAEEISQDIVSHHPGDRQPGE
jgi:hypothetical protein